MKRFPDLPPVWLLLCMIAVWALGRWVPLWRFENAWMPLAGALVVFAGTMLIFWSGTWFWRKSTSIEPGHRPKALIVEGPYRISRNPIYLGMAVILLGTAVWSCAPSGLLMLPLFVLIINRRFIAGEEAMLRATFGQTAGAYLDATRRWI